MGRIRPGFLHSRAAATYIVPRYMEPALTFEEISGEKKKRK
jgi:hypothetical protein